MPWPEERADMRGLSRSRQSVRDIPSALSLEDLKDAVPPIDPGIGVSDTFLRGLSIEPDAIGPFGAAVLSWEVEAPPQVRVKINSELVEQAGSRVVQPASSSTYRVFAVSGSGSRQLGDIGLTVDLSACSTFELLNPRSLMEGALTNNINTMEGMYTRGRQVVEFQAGRITCRLNLGREIDYFPDPTIRINCSFGLGVNDGRLVSWGEQVSADVSVPWYAWTYPGAVPGLAIALDMARDTATEGGFTVISSMVQLLEFWWAVADGMRRHSVRVGPSEDGAGRIEVTECPRRLLDRFAALDENRAVID
jgi:hypothetical protein